VTDEDFTLQEETYSTGDFELGGRLRVGYSSCECNWFVEGSFLGWEETESTDLVAAPYENTYIYGFSPGSMFASFRKDIDLVKDRVTFRYRDVSFRVGRELSRSCNFLLRGCAGASWVSIDFRNDLSVVAEGESTEFFRQHADFRGLGLGFGLAGDYCVCGGWGLVGALGVDLLYGSSDISESFSVTPNDSLKARLLSDGQSWDRFVPACNFRLGARYSSSCFSAELGWEMHYYVNVMRFTSDNIVPAVRGSGQIMSTEAQDLGFGGPYFSIGGRF
jgi:hypothetical protein